MSTYYIAYKQKHPFSKSLDYRKLCETKIPFFKNVALLLMLNANEKHSIKFRKLMF